MSSEKEYRYSEIFRSIQGEGQFTGVPTAWLRFWGCNLECNGFGQDDLDDSAKWIIPAQNIDIKDITKLEDLPVFSKGCDSGYSWSKRFRNLAHLGTASEIADRIMGSLTCDRNQTGTFLHAHSKQEQHMAFTGGEPMMSQAGIVNIMQELQKRNNCPLKVTVETNGTREIKDDLREMIYKFYMSSEFDGMVDDNRGTPDWFWSVSPKLRASGEPWSKTIRPEIVEAYSNASDSGQLKFVVDGSDRTWHEVDMAVEMYRKHDIDWQVWIMPVGADTNMQEMTAEKVAIGAMDRGFNVAARVHTYIFGNRIGT